MQERSNKLPDSVQSVGFEFLENIGPKFRHRQSLIMEFAGEDEYSLSLDLKTVRIPSYQFGQSIVSRVEQKGKQDNEKDSEATKHSVDIKVTSGVLMNRTLACGSRKERTMYTRLSCSARKKGK